MLIPHARRKLVVLTIYSVYSTDMDDGFSNEDIKEYLHTVLDAALQSETYFIIIGRDAGFLEVGDPIVYHIEGRHPEDIVETISQTIHATG